MPDLILCPWRRHGKHWLSLNLSPCLRQCALVLLYPDTDTRLLSPRPALWPLRTDRHHRSQSQSHLSEIFTTGVSCFMKTKTPSEPQILHLCGVCTFLLLLYMTPLFAPHPVPDPNSVTPRWIYLWPNSFSFISLSLLLFSLSSFSLQAHNRKTPKQ